MLTGVHATHDLTVHRLVRPGDRLTTRLAIAGITDIRPGANVTTPLTTVDSSGQLVATTTQDSIYLGVPTDSVDHPDPAPPPSFPTTERQGETVVSTVALAAGAAHTYTECARIWNPIHTDRAVALAAGLPGIILHGTATLAHGVTAVVDEQAQRRPERVHRIVARFSGMVELPSTITVSVWPGLSTTDDNTSVPFEVCNQDGVVAVKDEFVTLGNK